MTDRVDGQDGTDERRLAAATRADAATPWAGAVVTRGPNANAATAIVPRVGVTVREATAADVPFIDRLQKADANALGFLPTAALVGKIELRQVLVAESGQWAVSSGQEKTADDAQFASALPTAHCTRPTPVGYLIAADRYCRRDEVGYVTQLNVLPEYRRHLVAAALLQAQFDRAAYGCRLFCCWCAQDLAANDFWEAMGFTPIAFRTGSRTKGRGKDGKSAPRIHLFWQKRVKAGDTTTPWWYPAKTDGGEMREDRLVFPIPPGVHWRDVLPVVLPTRGDANGPTEEAIALPGPAAVDAALCLPADAAPAVRPSRRTKKGPSDAEQWAAMGQTSHARGFVPPPPPPTALQAKLVDPDARLAAREAIRGRMRKHPPAVPSKPPGHFGAIWFVPDYDDYQPNDTEIDIEIADSLSAERVKAEAKAAKQAAKQTAKQAAKQAAAKLDPRLIEMARELRDRWAEQADAVAALPGKHDVRKALPATAAAERVVAIEHVVASRPALPMAA